MKNRINESNKSALSKSKNAMRDLNSLPSDLPVPQDDGACDHLNQMAIPKIILSSRIGKIKWVRRVGFEQPAGRYCV
jgi:hypothetical protein